MRDIKNVKDYYVFIEQKNGIISEVSYELISEATKLVEKVPGYQVVGILLGNNIKKLADEAIAYGCDKVIVVDNPILDIYTTEPYTKAIDAIVNEYNPDALLIGATTIGRDLGPRVAARLQTGLTADATLIEVDPENEGNKLLWVTRPAFGGNLFGTIICPDHRPQMATIRPGVFAKNTPDSKNTGEVIDFKIEFNESDKNIEIKEVINKIAEGVDISKADIVISGGRGVGSEESFKVLEDVAKNIGGIVAGSRAAVDSGWIPKSKQVGQTGKTIRPLVYIACGISGAVQHTAGMDKADFIIAINKDKQAPIFETAHVGIVGDLFEVLPQLEKQMVQLKSK